MTRRTTRRRPRQPRTGNRSARPGRRPWRRYALWSLLALFVIGVAYTVYLDVKLRAQFDGKRWSLPARVYARPLELYPGKVLSEERFAQELEWLGYRYANQPLRPGTYARRGHEVQMVTRDFRFWDGYEPSQAVDIRFQDGRIAALQRGVGGPALTLVRMDPMFIGGIYPARMEDRILVRLADVPPVLIKALLAVEDRHFYHHHGLDFRAIGRALLANIRAGATVQGGSTLTQQLVKNFFLSNERTLWRKANEAVMALLLEWHYSKDEILEAYLNEVYLGQEGPRAIHGFGLASRFYFDRSVGELDLPQVSLLVGLVRGPSYYDPRRYPQRALARRNRVLDIMTEQGVISVAAAGRAKQAPLGVIHDVQSGVTPYPAFMDLVHRQLRRDYHESDLTSEGLQIFTTLDPFVQADVDAAVQRQLTLLERRYGLPAGHLEGAVVVSSPSSGEVLAVAGGRDARFAGFNRALDAQRPIGSLVKPAVYLTALAQPDKYTLLTPLDDEPLTLREPNGNTWSPSNYDNQAHGQVPMYFALTNSYNLASVRLGLAVGVPNVVATLHRLGIEDELAAYPSLLLGASALSPYEVTEMYQTFANGGFHSPPRAIREVLSSQGEPLQHYALHVEQAFDPATVEVLNSALRNVVRNGTARGLDRWLPAEVGAAGKTGTTNDLRDSWFAGFTTDYLAVVWLGMDDNRPTGMTGASGALQVWGDIMQHLPQHPWEEPVLEGVDEVWIDPKTLERGSTNCPDAVRLAFIKGTAPTQTAPCAGGAAQDAIQHTFDWFKRLFK